jgi:hypothetical protein
VAASVPVVVESPLPPGEVRARLVASLDEHAAALGGYGTGRLPFHGRVEGDTLYLRRVHVRARRGTPPLRARLEPRPGGGTRLVGTVAPDFMMLAPAVLAFVALVIGTQARIPVVAIAGLVGGFLSWRAFRRSARVEADAIRRALQPLLQGPTKGADRSA